MASDHTRSDRSLHTTISLRINPREPTVQKLTAVLFLTWMTACVGPRPCLSECKDYQEFFETCTDSDGMLCDAGLSMDCVDDPEVYEACMEDIESCDFDVLLEDGVFHICESADDVLESCKSQAWWRFNNRDEGDWDKTRDECVDPVDELTTAIGAADCAAVCALFGL